MILGRKEEWRMQMEIKYGEKLVTFNLPKDVLYEADIGAVRQPVTDEMIVHALRNPIGGKTLDQLIPAPDESIVIIVDDGTRITPQKRVLPIVLDELLRCGARVEQITILIGLGSHRPMTEEECRERFGEDVARRFKIVNHDYTNPEVLVDLGKTSSGIPISVNRLYYESALSIAVGTIVPHIYAGWSGGAKMIQPGVCGQETTAHTHLRAAWNCNEILGNIDNPVRKEIDELGVRTGLKFIVNCIVDSKKNLAGIVAGDPIKAHRAGAAISEEISVYEIPERADIVIATSHPADRDFWQANKGFIASSFGIKKGGTLIFVTPCTEGNAPDHPLFCELGTTPLDVVRQGLERGEYDHDLIAVATYIAMSAAREHMHTIMVSEGMNKEESARMGLDWAPTIDAALEKALRRHGEDATIGVVHHSADILLRVKDNA
jgi:nickel-dependent lactate racemase